MKTIILGDTHGRSFWKRICQLNDHDRAIFNGDYFDTHDDISYTEQIHNFKEILDYKKNSGKDVILNVGNHDLHYMDRVSGVASGYSLKNAPYINQILMENIDDLTVAYSFDNYLVTHAGVSKTFIANNNIPDDEHIVHNLNALFKMTPNSFNFTPGRHFSFSGDEVCQTPLWIRPRSLALDAIESFSQIVGHTQQTNISRTIVNEKEIYFIDTMGTSQEFLYYEDGKISIKQ